MLIVISFVLSLFLVFLITRKIIFFKKRNFSIIRWKKLINYFIDYYYFYTIKRSFKGKEYFVVTMNNPQSLIDKIDSSKNKVFLFPAESLFSYTFQENRGFIFVHSNGVLDEKEGIENLIKKRYIRFFKRLRSSNDFYNFKGIVSIKNKSEDISLSLALDYFTISEFNNIFKTDIPYYSVSEILLNDETFDVISDFNVSNASNLIGYQERIKIISEDDLKKNYTRGCPT